MGNGTIPKDIQKQLGPVITKGIKNIFSELFHTEVLENADINDEHRNQMVCIGRLHQKGIVIDLRFFFTKQLLKPLLANLYAEEFLENDAVFEDAATEIVNIVCGQIKAFMNKNDYELEMDLPTMGIQGQDSTNADALLNVCFSLNQDECFLIDLESTSE